ncbi:hypothetical protein [Pseudoduganella sp. RAF53_2]|uniref:hypothetical protein n=1 Tax=unclassified Pseudoduganella TaxID=2637179 RepID=UPI003F945415
MRFSRRTRWFAVVLALLGMFCMQLAVAAYVCPQAVSAEKAEMVNMPGCTGMDAGQPSLCKAHCQPKQQLSDKVEIPQIAPFSLSGPGYLAGFALLLAPQEASSSLAPPVMERATAPPISIANCCFRI